MARHKLAAPALQKEVEDRLDRVRALRDEIDTGVDATRSSLYDLGVACDADA